MWHPQGWSTLPPAPAAAPPEAGSGTLGSQYVRKSGVNEDSDLIINFLYSGLCIDTRVGKF